MTDEHLDRTGARIAYSVDNAGAADGSTRTIVTLHGLTGSRASDDTSGIFDWRPLADVACLVRYDARGHGASTGRQEPADYAWSVLADDLLAFVDLVSPDEPVDAVGASMGTATILWAASQRPERFRKLALVIPPTAWETRAGQGDIYRQGADMIERGGIDAFLDAMKGAPTPALLVEGGWDLAAVRPSVTEELLPSVFRGAAATDLPDPAVLAGIPNETLLLPWATDPGHPVSTSERLLEILPNATMEIASTPDLIRAWPERIAAFFAS